MNKEVMITTTAGNIYKWVFVNGCLKRIIKM